LEGGGKRPFIGRGKRRAVGRLPAVEGFPDPAHFARDREIPHTHFPHAFVHVATKSIKNPLAECAHLRRLAFETLQNQHGMEHDHFQAAVDRIRHPVDLVESARSRLCHDRAIEARDGVDPRGAAK
jgi:hypothetical protein